MTHPFVRMRSGHHLGDAKMSEKGTSLNFFYEIFTEDASLRFVYHHYSMHGPCELATQAYFRSFGRPSMYLEVWS